MLPITAKMYNAITPSINMLKHAYNSVDHRASSSNRFYFLSKTQLGKMGWLTRGCRIHSEGKKFRKNSGQAYEIARISFRLGSC
jgi:hypothetical protein